MPHVVVVGAGVFGVWTAHFLRASGIDVTIIDAYGPGNSRSSSGDESRILRCGYGPDAIYTRLARRSLDAWHALQTRGAPREAPIWWRCGVLWLPRGADAYVDATRETLQAERCSVEVLDTAELRARYPHLNSSGVESALLEPDCGVAMARRAVRSVCMELIAGGARYIRGQVEAPGSSRRRIAVRLVDGSEIDADAAVYACGAWLPKVFPDLLRGVIRPTRQVVVYFGTPAGDDRFGPAHTPAWIDFGSGVYGVPDLDGRGLKVGIDAHGPPIDPDDDNRVPDPESLTRARAWLAERFPSLADAPVVETRVCAYENTDTGDFLIDRHPQHENVWLVGGGSGHGFKHGPAVGEYVARLITGSESVEPRFALAAKGREPRRLVH
jgi:glycine/D-amino acid oxidase-like deaminating enzyme